MVSQKFLTNPAEGSQVPARRAARLDSPRAPFPGRPLNSEACSVFPPSPAPPPSLSAPPLVVGTLDRGFPAAETIGTLARPKP